MPSRRSRGPSAIDKRQKDLEREGTEVRRRICRLESTLAGAPARVAACRKRQQEEQLAVLHSHTRGALNEVFSAAADDRPAPVRRRRSLRRERRAQWIQFLLLLLTLSVLLWFLVLKMS